eukprot:3024951-Rhodomonas_salina.4
MLFSKQHQGAAREIANKLEKLGDASVRTVAQTYGLRPSWWHDLTVLLSVACGIRRCLRAALYLSSTVVSSFCNHEFQQFMLVAARWGSNGEKIRQGWLP